MQAGSVGETLAAMAGVWHDSVRLFQLDGTELDDDTQAGSGTPGASPFENLVYLDFDGEVLRLTNVHIKGRPLSAKTFTGRMRDGVLVFDPLGPGSIENIGMSGGPGIVTFNARVIDKACAVYMEPDFIMMTGPDTRVRHTVLYRDGVAARTLTAHGTRLTRDCARRHASDPRGAEGAVHSEPFVSSIWAHLA
jgi:hypothetical protein